MLVTISGSSDTYMSAVCRDIRERWPEWPFIDADVMLESPNIRLTDEKAVIDGLVSDKIWLMFLTHGAVKELRSLVERVAPHELRKLTHVYAYAPSEEVLHARLSRLHRSDDAAISHEIAACRARDREVRAALAFASVPYHLIPGEYVGHASDAVIAHIRSKFRVS